MEEEAEPKRVLLAPTHPIPRLEIHAACLSIVCHKLLETKNHFWLMRPLGPASQPADPVGGVVLRNVGPTHSSVSTNTPAMQGAYCQCWWVPTPLAA